MDYAWLEHATDRLWADCSHHWANSPKFYMLYYTLFNYFSQKWNLSRNYMIFTWLFYKRYVIIILHSFYYVSNPRPFWSEFVYMYLDLFIVRGAPTPFVWRGQVFSLFICLCLISNDDYRTFVRICQHVFTNICSVLCFLTFQI